MQVFAGALLVAMLSILTELTLALIQRTVVSAGLSGRHSDKNEPFVGAATTADVT